MDLSHLRKKIDELDGRIIRLLNDRAAITLSIGQEKIKNGRHIYAPDREQDVLKRIKKLNAGPIRDEAVEAIYREVMSASLALEKPLRIAYMGPEATFSHLASLKKFGSSVEHVACGNVAEVFSRVENADCDYGVVPIENSIEGVVTHTMDLLVDSELKICSQVLLDVTHYLMSKGTLTQIKEIYSHPQILGQCRQWLMHNMPKAHIIPVESSTRAAQLVAKKKNAACIASLVAASLYGLTILKKNIQDSAHNITRFLVISTMEVAPTGHDRTSLVFSIKDRVGALHAMLTPFMKHKINLTKIESRPSKRKAWDYYFFVDCEGHQDDPRVARALDQLEGMCKFLKILGSYPDI
ncbi:MAG: prephenate dehydratase [Candidatus Omnitrophica bacterium]|nr:prephenate dehydratase [Candidatus Omnitrophota bacterium]MDE2214965.1 prephenate dehydratase [Candidatus Omnitrophota bacterium]MDE2230904.1 prephenate dehydratase [Candidatus Omnitrophota bacterium]